MCPTYECMHISLFHSISILLYDHLMFFIKGEWFMGLLQYLPFFKLHAHIFSIFLSSGQKQTHNITLIHFIYTLKQFYMAIIPISQKLREYWYIFASFSNISMVTMVTRHAIYFLLCNTRGYCTVSYLTTKVGISLIIWYILF